MEFDIIRGPPIKLLPLTKKEDIEGLNFPSCFGRDSQRLEFIPEHFIKNIRITLTRPGILQKKGVFLDVRKQSFAPLFEKVLRKFTRLGTNDEHILVGFQRLLDPRTK